MKKTKKMLSLVVALVMALTMMIGTSVITFAEKVQKYTITVTNSDQIHAHTYKAYAIFYGTKDATSDKLENVQWGIDDTEAAALITELKKLNAENGPAFADGMSAAQVAAEMSGITSESDVKALASIIGQFIRNNSIEEDATLTQNSEDPKKYEAELFDGYYLIQEEDGATTDGEAKTRFMLLVNGDVTKEAKDDTTSSEKKIKDANDSTPATEGWQDSADYDIGDNIPFQLTANIANDYAEYKVYKLTFHDKEEAGLTFDASTVKVFVDGVEISSNYEVITATEDGDTFEVKFADLKAIEDVHAGSKITVEYMSKLNENANIGYLGNKNTMHITYSNNPSDEQGGEYGSTPDDTVIAFTYQLVINKKDEAGKDLDGADFKLEKKVNGNWEEVTRKEGNKQGHTFTFKGLDDGDYRITETETPKGYNSIDPIEFKVTAEHEIESADPKLTRLNAASDSGHTFSVDVQAGSTNPAGVVKTDVENRSGSVLPSTGGIGTTIFYVLGSILVLGAGIVLIARRKVNA